MPPLFLFCLGLMFAVGIVRYLRPYYPSGEVCCRCQRTWQDTTSTLGAYRFIRMWRGDLCLCTTE